MKYLPVGLDIRRRKCLVVGGGRVGTRKVATLLRAGGDVVLVSPEATPELAAQAAAGVIRWVRERYTNTHLHGALLAVAATDDEELNASVVRGAIGGGVLVCDASVGERSTLIFGALHQAGGITVGVFTDGESPALARETRDRISILLAEDAEE